MKIGQKVLMLRKRAGLTREEISAKIGVKNTDVLMRTELSRTKPQPWTLLRIADALGMSFCDLIADTDFEDSISELRTIPNQTVIAYRDSEHKLRILFQPDENAKRYDGGSCTRFRCYAGQPHMHCCYDCPDSVKCPDACENDPKNCGLYHK